MAYDLANVLTPILQPPAIIVTNALDNKKKILDLAIAQANNLSDCADCATRLSIAFYGAETIHPVPLQWGFDSGEMGGAKRLREKVYPAFKRKTDRDVD